MSKSVMNQRWMGLALFLAILSLGGCGQEVVNFNNSLAKMEDKLEAPMEALMSHFEKWSANKTIDGAKAEADYTAVLSGIDGVVKEVEAVPVINAKLAKEFHTAYLAYYASIRGVIAGEIRQGIDALKDTKTSDAEKSAKWESLATAISTKLMAATNQLQSVQKQFAQAHNMKLK